MKICKKNWNDQTSLANLRPGAHIWLLRSRGRFLFSIILFILVYLSFTDTVDSQQYWLLLFIYSFIRSFIHSSIHSSIHPFIYSSTYACMMEKLFWLLRQPNNPPSVQWWRYDISTTIQTIHTIHAIHAIHAIQAIRTIQSTQFEQFRLFRQCRHFR